MKTTKSAQVLNQVSRLDELRALRAQMEKEEKTIKEAIRAVMGDEASLKVGDFLVLVSEVSRTDLDKKALAADLGAEIVKYEKVTVYERLEIKKA